MFSRDIFGYSFGFAGELDTICRQTNSAAIAGPVRHNSTPAMAEGPYARCRLSCIAGSG